MHTTADTIITAAVIFVIGLSFVLFSKKIGVGFCRLGKAIWKSGTIGPTDMHWFYKEDRAYVTFRIAGIVLLGMSFLMLVVGLAKS